MKKRTKESVTAYLLIAPMIILSGIFFLFPVFYSGILSFVDWNLFNNPLFVGFRNFKELLASDYFRETLLNTLLYSIGLLLLLMSLGLALALLLN